LATKLIAAVALAGKLQAKVRVVFASICALLDRHVIGAVIDRLERPTRCIVGPARLVGEFSNGRDVAARRIPGA
jgi:hypothetical protein